MKKIRNNISKYAVLLALTATPLVVTSCRQELDINVDPNNPSEASLSGLLSGSQVGFAFALGGEGTRMPASIVQHYAGHRAQPLDYAQYRITSSSTDVAWGAFYNNVLMGMRELENKAAASGNRAYVGVSKLLQAHAFSVVTDMFGDIPFSEALQGRANITPAYDRQENIYPALIAMIDEGLAALSAGTETISGDIVYGGDVAKWKKYGNSLKLRLLNHLSSKQPNAAANFLASNPSLIETSVDDAKVAFGSVTSNANPIHQFDVISGRKDQAVASTIVDKMKALSDPRAGVYFEPDAVVQNVLKQSLEGKDYFHLGMGIGYEFDNKLNIGIRYHLGLSDALETQQNGHRYREQNNMVNAFFLNIGYRFTFDGYNNF